MMISSTRFKTAAAVLLLCFLLASCATVTPVPRPGAINAFDSTAYDTLISVQAAIQQAKIAVSTPGLAQYKGQLNQAIAAYNTTIAAWKVYHEAGAGVTSDQTAALQTEVADLVSQVGKLLTALGVKL